jgi:hypothetical protein
VIVDFTVVGDMQRAIFIRHRLVAVSNVNDTEPPVAQADSLVDENPFIVGTAVSNYIAHAFKDRRVNMTLCLA